MRTERTTMSQPVMSRLLSSPPLSTLGVVTSEVSLAADSWRAFPMSKGDAVVAPTKHGYAVHATATVVAAAKFAADSHVANRHIGCTPRHFQRERSS